jgi:hypothetical protein
MSTFRAAAAPTRHPPGEAHTAPIPLPLPATRLAQVAAPSGYLGGAASTPQQRNRSGPVAPCRPLWPLSPGDNTTRDIPTPTRPTTSASCRQKRIRRHHATRCRTRLWWRLRRRFRSLLHAPAARSSRFGVRDPSHSFRDKQFNRTAPCRPVASRQHDKRRPNSNPLNNFNRVSPKTHQATPRDTRHKNDRPAAGPCR